MKGLKLYFHLKTLEFEENKKVTFHTCALHLAAMFVKFSCHFGWSTSN